MFFHWLFRVPSSRLLKSSVIVITKIVDHLEDGSTARVSHNRELRLGHL